MPGFPLPCSQQWGTSCWSWECGETMIAQRFGYQSREATNPADLRWLSGWWFGIWILFFHILGKWSQLIVIFFRGLKPPTSYTWFMFQHIVGLNMFKRRLNIFQDLKWLSCLSWNEDQHAWSDQGGFIKHQPVGE